MVPTPSIAIIGAGVGGLAAAIHLARAGVRVAVYEKNSIPGGKAGVIREQGFRFDTGPSLLTMPSVLRDIFNLAGKNIEDYFTLRKLNILCRYFYPDGTILNAYSDPKALAGEIERVSNDTAIKTVRYLEYCKTIFDHTADIFLYNDFRELKNLIKPQALKTLFLIHQIDPFRTMHQANTRYFDDPRIVQLFDRYATYNGSNPYDAPATLNVIQHVEYNLGGYIIPEGIHQIPVALMTIAKELEVEIYLNTPVNNIAIKNNSVTGIQTSNGYKHYDAVISNVDTGFTYSRLLNNTSGKDAKKYFKQEPSSSALVFYWGIKTGSAALETHNIFFSNDYQAEFEMLFKRHACPGDPTIYVYISSRINNNDAPPGHENWFVMINAPYNSGQDWEYEIDRMRTIIIDKLSLSLKTDIRSRIVFERILTPPDIEQQSGSLHGSLYGISSNSRFAAFLRQPIKSRDYRNLYFCGGSTHPGGGLPLVMLSGKIAAHRILNDYKIRV